MIDVPTLTIDDAIDADNDFFSYLGMLLYVPRYIKHVYCTVGGRPGVQQTTWLRRRRRLFSS